MIVPIDLWHELQAEKETAYLLKSEAMKERLLAARKREQGQGISLAKPVKNLEFDPSAFEDLAGCWPRRIDDTHRLEFRRGS